MPAILALATAAMLAGARSLYAIAQWGRLQEPGVGQVCKVERVTERKGKQTREIRYAITSLVETGGCP